MVPAALDIPPELRRAIAERSAVPSSVHGPGGRVLWVNSAFARLCSRPVAACLGADLDELLGLAAADAGAWARLKGWLVAVQEGRCVVAGRGGLSLQVEVLSLLVETAGAAQALLNWHDQTEELRTRRQLQQVLVERTFERERLGHILAGTQVGAWEVNLVTGEARMDDAWAAMFGWRREELHPWDRYRARAMMHEDDLPVTDDQVRRHIAGELPAVDVEQRVRHRDGHWLWVHSRGKVATWTPDGRPEWLSGSHMDISERKRQQGELEAQRAYMRQLLSSLPGVVFDFGLDEAGQVCPLYLSEGLRTLFGIEPADAIADPRLLLATVPDEDRAAIRAGIAESARTLGLLEVEYRVTVKGAQRWLSLHAQPSRHAAGELRWQGMLLDVTRRHELADELAQARAAAEEASRAKSAFLATMSHEIRSPMNGVLGMTDVLMSASGPEDHAEAVQVIRESAGALLRLIDDILDFSKIEAGRLEMERLPLNPALLLEKVAESLASSTAAEHVAVSVRLAPGLPHQVWGDPTRLRQILYNLLGNAIKFSRRRPEEAGRVRALLMRADPPRPGLVFRIEDDGIGMDAETQARLFHPFTQADASTTRRYGGTGLGLAIVKRLVEAFEGELRVDSRPGAGTRFDVWLPLAVADPALERPPVDLSGLNCFIVGGEQDAVAALAQSFCGAGASVRRVPTLPALLQACAGGGSAVAVLPREGPAAAVATDAAELVALRQASGCDLRFLLLASAGRSQALQLVAPDVGVVRALRRQPLWRALATMAGRASPELPAPRTGWAASPARPAPAGAAPALRVLVVDDEATNRKVAVRQLQLLDLQADVACDGEEALQRWRDGHYALVLTDLHMPKLDGYAFARRLREEEARLGRPRTPLLALTANALRGEAHRAREAGIDDYLTKPIPLDALQAALARWLAGPGTAAAAAPAVSPALPAAAAPVLDLAVLRSLIGDDPGVVAEFLAHFREAFAAHVDEMRQHFASGDLTRVAGTAHKLKSSARAVGAQTLAQLCEALEALRAGHDDAGRARVWLAFESATEALRQALEQAEEAGP